MVRPNNLETTMLAALAVQPTDLEVPTMLDRAIRDGLAHMNRQDEQERRDLIAAVPQLDAAQLDETRRTVALLAGAIADRLGHCGDFEARVFTGALTGAVLAALDHARISQREPARLDRTRHAIDYLAIGFPLTRSPGK